MDRRRFLYIAASGGLAATGGAAFLAARAEAGRAAAPAAPGPGARVRAVAGAPVASAQAPAREDAGAVMTNAVGR